MPHHVYNFKNTTEIVCYCIVPSINVLCKNISFKNICVCISRSSLTLTFVLELVPQSGCLVLVFQSVSVNAVKAQTIPSGVRHKKTGISRSDLTFFIHRHEIYTLDVRLGRGILSIS